MTKRQSWIPMLALAFLLLAGPARGADKKDFHFWTPCTQAQIKAYEEGLKAQVWESAVDLASCYATRVMLGKGDRLDNAKKGREFAELAVMKLPDSADAHYMLAVLIGDVAEYDPWYDKMTNGLAMVPKIQHQAALAAKLDPAIDQGGPDYVLGQLYLQAPAPPMSIGDVDKALLHFRLAVKMAPKSVANHVGLAQAYLKKNDSAKACEQITEALQLPKPTSPAGMKYWKRAQNINQNSCKK